MSAQSISKIGFNNYELLGKNYSFNKLDAHFSSHPLVKGNFKKAQLLNRFSNVLGALTVGEFFIGYYLYTRPPALYDDTCEFFCFSPINIIGTVILLVVPITGTFGLITRSMSTKFKNKAIQSFNDRNQLNDLGKINERPCLEWAQNGLGIVLRF